MLSIIQCISRYSESCWNWTNVHIWNRFSEEHPYEPPHDKTNKMTLRTAKAQISLAIRPVWSETSLSAWRKLWSLATHWAHSEVSDQTGWISRLIWVLAGRTCHFVGFVMRRLIWAFSLKGDQQRSLMDENHAISTERQMTNDNRFIAYWGKRHTLIDHAKYRLKCLYGTHMLTEDCNIFDNRMWPLQTKTDSDTRCLTIYKSLYSNHYMNITIWIM